VGACVNVSTAKLCRGNLTLKTTENPRASRRGCGLTVRARRATSRTSSSEAKAPAAHHPPTHAARQHTRCPHGVIMMIGSCTSQIQVPQRAAAGSARGTLEHKRWALQPKFKVRTLSHSPAKATPNDANARRRQTPAATSCRHNHHRAGATRAQPARFDQLPDCHLFSEVVAHARLA
jgi:hypothetical protein